MIDKPLSYHQKVAQNLIEQLKKGTAPWQKPWNEFIAMNPLSGKRYRGINALHLMAQNYADPRWLTYKQGLTLDAQVRKGEKCTVIQYWKFTELQNKLDEHQKTVFDRQGKPIKEEVSLERPTVFYAAVFNAEQIEGMPPLENSRQDLDSILRAENILTSSGAKIIHAPQNRAYYQPGSDQIVLPEKAQFSSPDQYYATALHELGHWSGHSSRLNRDLSHPFGSEGYAKEELRAEIASMILGHTSGIDHEIGQHAAYVNAWIKILQNDPLEIFRAAADAEKIHDYLFEQKLVRENLVNKEIPVAMKESINAAEKIFINVPYDQKDAAKILGARWDRAHLSWFIREDQDKTLFTPWMDETHQKERKKIENSENVEKISSNDLSNRSYLAVPFNEHKEAKALGALWDKTAKSWYINAIDEKNEKLSRWLPENFKNVQSPAVNPREEFTQVMKSLGCVISNAHPIMDGNTHRIKIEGDKRGENSGFYVGHLDGHPAGYIKNNRTGIETKWKSKGYILDDSQKAQMQAQMTHNQRLRRLEQADLHENAAQTIATFLQMLKPITSPTPYLDAKGIAIYSGIFTDSEKKNTCIPAFDANGKPWTMQTILEDGSKRFYKDGRKEGCFHVVGGYEALARVPALVIAEGYATAASLTQALNYSAVAAFDAGNLLPVVKALHAKFPDKPIVIAADNDVFLEKTRGINPGIKHAQEAAVAVDAKVMVPFFTAEENEAAKISTCFTDFNDLAQKSVLGELGIKRQVQYFVNKVIAEHSTQQKTIKHSQKIMTG